MSVINDVFIATEQLQVLIAELQADGYHCVGPQIRNNAIVYDTLNNIEQLPQGVSEQQQPGFYKLETTQSPRLFAWANGPHSIKPHVFSARETLWSSNKTTDGDVSFSSMLHQPIPVAIIGVRACDLAALYLQDKHFLSDGIQDPYYRARREGLFLVAVNCTHPAATCFCASTGDGPRASYGYDIALSELDDGFLIHAYSDKGQFILEKLATSPATNQQVQIAKAEIEKAAQMQIRKLPSRNLNAKLFANLNHARWEQVAERCLSCGNCTLVCPTCFCFSEDDIPALDGISSDHTRQWDSCFTPGHSYIHGITIRASTAQRYRQWLTHKLGSWHDQYGRSGCVGCGRCITWCPVGIDITEEVSAICAEQSNA